MPDSKFTLARSPIGRRIVLGGAALVALGALVTSLTLVSATDALAQRKSGPAEVPVEELLKPGDLPELTLGKDDAPITVVEYASMTCGHCAAFSKTVLPEFKKKYIDTGEVRLIWREFPLDNLAAAASMLARCVDHDKTFPLIETLFDKQADWAFATGNPVPKLFDIAKQVGFTQESFDKCLTDQKLLDNVTAVRTRAADEFGVNSTPTFFINGKRLQGAPVLAEFDKMIEPLLKKTP